MTDMAEIYKCIHCGNICEILHTGTAQLVCCGTKMMLMSPELLEGPHEKHIPVIEKNEKGYNVTIGSVLHPMTEEHYIEWIELRIGDKSCKQFLKPNDEPKAFFPSCCCGCSKRSCSSHLLQFTWVMDIFD